MFTENVITSLRHAAVRKTDFYGSRPLPKNVSSLSLICQLLNHNYIFFKAISYRGLTIPLCQANNFSDALFLTKKKKKRNHHLNLIDVSEFFPQFS